MSNYTCTLTTLTPLFIGDGNELRHGFDFMIQNNKTYRLDEDKILEAKGTQLVKDRQGNYPYPGSLLSAADYNNASYFRYVLNGTPRSRQADARLKACIKDCYDRPYIPGSSLKGALRTALAWCGWGEINIRLERSSIGRSRAWAAKNLEQRIFGKDPNTDLLRSLQVSDLQNQQNAADTLGIINAQVLTYKSAGSPVELEAILGERDFNGTIHIDDTLFSKESDSILHFNNRQHWLTELLPRVQKHSRARLNTLIPWFEKTENGMNIANFYRRLLGANIAENQALIQLGWGCGWDGTTFWTHLQKDALLFEQIVKEFNMHKAQRGSPPRKIGDPFPRSRRAAMSVKNNIAQPAAPFGWALLELTEKDR